MRSSLPTVSVVLIVKDEAAVLADCLASVAWADQVVVYDTGSTDDTREIARRHTDTVVAGYWDDDFGAARARALAHATGDWVLSIDADEVFEGDVRRLREQLGRGGVVAHTVLVRNVADGTALPLGLGAADTVLSVLRVFRRDLHTWAGVLHEQPVLLSGGSAPTTALAGVELRHVGYQADVVRDKDKGRRNIALARVQVERARGGDAAELEGHRMQLARSLTLAGEHAEALAVADELLAAGFVRPRHAVMLARSVYASAFALGDADAVDRWLAAWEQHDDNPAFALAARARIAVSREDAAGALAAVERIPTTTVNGLGERVSRVELVTVELWAHAVLGDRRRALAVARDAVARGVAPGAPAGLVGLLGEDACRRLLADVPAAMWREYVTWCVMDATAEGRTFLRWMHAVRPGDAAVLGGVALLAPTLSLEEAAEWAAAMRSAGAPEQCPLVLIAQDPRMHPRQRAVAGALAYSAYADERGLAALEAALADVDPADEAELAGQLEIVAPGLVSAPA